MAAFVTVASTDELAPGEGMAVTVPVGDQQVGIALFNVDGRYHAIGNACTHVGGSLGNGRLRDTTVTCPLHGARFDVTTGAVRAGPAHEPVDRYPVRVVDDEIQVRA